MHSQSPYRSVPSLKLAGNKRRSLSGNGGLLNRMFGSTTPTVNKSDDSSISTNASTETPSSPVESPTKLSDDAVRSLSQSSDSAKSNQASTPASEKKRRNHSVSKAKDILRSSLSFGRDPEKPQPQSSMQRLSKADPALGVPQGSLNNSAGESLPGPHSTFRVGVTEDRNKKCRRTMEDTHAYLYNFLSTPRTDSDGQDPSPPPDNSELPVVETDNGYFAVFDGHAGTFAADWCGKKLHLLLEDTIRKHPNTPIPELLDLTFTLVDQQLEKLPVKNSGCTAVTAVLRWEDRVPNPASATGSAYINQAAVVKASQDSNEGESEKPNSQPAQDRPISEAKIQATEAKLRQSATRQRVLYTANVGDARIVLCRNGRALRLSYDHKGSDESEGRRIANAGGLILSNRVNGVLAVTRALGDSYMKDLVTGHPYTTETVIQPDQDEFLILACDGLWDVCTDQEAVDLIRTVTDPQAASKILVDHALGRFSTDNLSCMVVRFNNQALKARKTDASIGVEGDEDTAKGGISEADAIVEEARRHVEGKSETIAEEDSEEEKDEPENVEGLNPDIALNPDAPKSAIKNQS